MCTLVWLRDACSSRKESLGGNVTPPSGFRVHPQPCYDRDQGLDMGTLALSGVGFNARSLSYSGTFNNPNVYRPCILTTTGLQKNSSTLASNQPPPLSIINTNNK